MVKSERRPSTATLIKPTILDTKLLGIFDMTTVSREHLLAIKNLVHSTPRCKCRPMTKAVSLKCDQKADPVQGHEKIQKVYKVLNKTYRIRTNVRQKLHDLSEAAEIIEKPIALPAPCSTCGRSDQPERFHSHPSRVENQKKCVNLEEKKTVQKPVAMKFRSAKTKLQEEKEKEKDISKKAPLSSKLKLEHKSPKLQSLDVKKSPEITPVKESTPKRKIKIPTKWREAIKKSVQQKNELTQQEKSKPKEEDNKDASEGGYKLDNWNPAPVSGGRKRKVVCYLCSQEFGTAALPAHEAMCIQKYLKQNNQQNTANDKKEELTSGRTAASPQLSDNWKLAWEITQASLVPCDYCDRKFLPARLEAHQRICALKSNKEHIKNKVNNASYAFNQPGVLCEHCGKRYGSNSIVIHKEQCVKKCRNLETIDANREDKENTTRKSSLPLTVICYICGRNFGTKSIAFHEPQCMKKWKIENGKLPSHLQKALPIKFDIFEQDSQLNHETQELFWKAHQAQLVPCPKCSRTFYPDRLEVHLKGCKGLTKIKK